MNLSEALKSIQKIDSSWLKKAEDYMNSLAMPPGALGCTLVA